MSQLEPRQSVSDPLGNALAEAYSELRRMAAAKMAQEHKPITIQTTELVHEAYLRLLRDGEMPAWESRAHFFGAAAEAMRRILIDRARRRKSQRRGGGSIQEPLADVSMGAEVDALDLIALSESLATLEAESPRHAEVVKLRFFAGLSVSQIAEVTGRSVSTVKNDWAYAKTWLRLEIGGHDASSQGGAETT